VILNPSAPVGHPISVSTPFNAPKTFSPTISGTRLDYSTACLVDPVDSVCKTTVIVKNQGSWTVDPSTGDVTFTPDSNFSGVATSLTYSVSDIFGQKGSTTLTITVSPSPKIVEKIKSVETQPGVSVSIVSTTSFTPPTGDSWNSQSTQIVNPVSGDLVSTYTNDQGTWTVNPSTNTVVFAPKDTFSGDATIGLSMTTKSGLKIVNKFKSVVYKKLVVTVYFNNNSPVLTPADIAKLKATMKIIAGGKITKTKVDGYVLISPSLAADKLLSTQRARSTSKFIASYGLKNIIAQGKGRAPESNATARRAVITITYLPANGSGSTGSNGSGSTGSNGSGPTGSNGSGPCIITYSKTPHTMATTVYFGNNSPVLTVEDIAKLKALIASLNGSKISLTQVDGYVLVSPSLAADQLLSNQRAESTSKFIKSYGFDNMVAKGMGRAPELNITARRAVITITYYPVISRVNCEAIVVNKTISTTVYFGNNSPVLTTEAIAKIESLLSEVKGHSIVSSKVNSYVLTSPSLSADMALSIARGESVARYLTSHGISNVSSFGSGRAPELNEDARKAVITIDTNKPL
jgi:CshA-type fibril repeat protein